MRKKIIEEKDLTPKPVSVKIETEHLANPQWIELRKATDEELAELKLTEKIFIEARLHDCQFSSAVGAKTVETILRENGFDPVLHADEKLEIKFSIYDGQVISIEKVEE